MQAKTCFKNGTFSTSFFITTENGRGQTSSIAKVREKEDKTEGNEQEEAEEENMESEE